MRLLSVMLFFTWLPLVAQHGRDWHPDRKMDTASLKQWTRDIMQELSIKHPGFYRYTSKPVFKRLIDSTLASITDSLSEIEIYRKTKPLVAQIGCLHTGIRLSNDAQHFLDKSSTLVPIEVFIDEESRVFITKNLSGNQYITPRSELKAINGRPIDEIIQTLFRAMPSDGYNLTEKRLLFNHRFAFWYQTMVEMEDRYTLTLFQDGQTVDYEVCGVTAEAFPSLNSLEHNYKKALEFEIKNQVGILTVHTFAHSNIRKSRQHFRKFVRNAFKKLKEQKIKNMVIDLRYNTGGTDANAAYLASYLFEKPFRYWDRIEITAPVAKYMNGAVKFFYCKPTQKDSMYLWTKCRFTREFDFYETQQPAKNHFEGQVYLLTNGFCMSSCSDFVAVVSYNQKAKTIGQETGGGYQGNTSGIMPTVRLPHGLLMTIPLQKYTNAVDTKKNGGHGSMPDYELVPTLQNWMLKHDAEMEKALELIGDGRRN